MRCYEESYSYYGRVVCRACKIKLENQFQAPGTTNGDSETEASTAEVRTKEGIDVKCEVPVAEEQPVPALAEQTEAEIPIAEVPIGQNRDMKHHKESTMKARMSEVFWVAIKAAVVTTTVLVLLQIIPINIRHSGDVDGRLTVDQIGSWDMDVDVEQSGRWLVGTY